MRDPYSAQIVSQKPKQRIWSSHNAINKWGKCNFSTSFFVCNVDDQKLGLSPLCMVPVSTLICFFASLIFSDPNAASIRRYDYASTSQAHVIYYGPCFLYESGSLRPLVNNVLNRLDVKKNTSLRQICLCFFKRIHRCYGHCNFRSQSRSAVIIDTQYDQTGVKSIAPLFMFFLPNIIWNTHNNGYTTSKGDYYIS